jgi:peptidoglycan/xylan/chitin deacetylase (PgdA/CDA1 family)
MIGYRGKIAAERKAVIFSIIRNLHLLLAHRGLPRKIAVLLHSLESAHYTEFSAFVNYFKGLGYRFCTPDEYITDKDKLLFLSFDDNYKSWFNALGLLDRLGVKATFFLNTLPIDDHADLTTIEDYYTRIGCNGQLRGLSTADIRAISEAGHIIGCHSHSHYDLGSLPYDRAIQEIRVNREILEEIIGSPVWHLAYPFGMRRHFSRALRAWCRQARFRTVSNGIPGCLHGRVDRFNIFRNQWIFSRSIEQNQKLLGVDGRLFARLTGRSAIG